jgi:hypothetical protein
LVLLGVCYLLASVTRVNHLVYTLTKGNYHFYQFVLYAGLYVFSFAVLLPERPVRMGLMLAAGPVVGYVSALLGFFLLPLNRGETLARVLTVKDLSSDFFLSPAISFSWFVGFIFFLLIAFFQRGSGQALKDLSH